MTCSSCESNLRDCLLRINGVNSASVSVILGRAVVEGTAQPDEIIRIASRRTGFKLALYESAATLFLKFDKLPKKVPEGVAISTRGTIVKFSYDAEIISPREIFEFYTIKQDASPTVVEGFAHTIVFWNTLGFRVIISMMLTIPVLVLAYLPSYRPLEYGAIQLSLVTVIMIYIISPLYKAAISTLIRRHEIEMDLLVVMSTSIAYIFSVVAFAFTAVGRPIAEPFWETPALLVTLIIFGRWITARARQTAVEQIKSLSNEKPKTATLRSGRVVDAALLAYNDVIVVQPGCTIPSDGVIEQGETEVSEAMFSGESMPKLKSPGSDVFAGSINVLSRIDVRVTRLSSENALTKIRHLINMSQVNKPRIQEYTDRVAGYLAPIALVAASLAFFAWFVVNLKVRKLEVYQAAIQGLTYAIAVLAVSCPCTIGLAVPMNVVVASGIAAGMGILIKDTQALELMHRVKAVVFDKTGTLTRGEGEVVEEILFHSHAREYVKRLVAGASHPVAKAISKHLGDAEPFDGIHVFAGKGLEVKINGVLRGGSLKWLEVENPFEGRNISTFCAKLDDQLLAIYGLSDELRPEAADVVRYLKSQNIQVYLNSGDTAGPTFETADKLGISHSNVRSGLVPNEKAQFVRQLQDEMKGPILFCGDGVNDAPALSQADIGVSFVSASEITSSAASVLFLSNELDSIRRLRTLSLRVYRRIILNFAWAGLYNLLAISLAGGALVVWRIEPKWAGLGELVSVLPIIVVGWSLKWHRKS